MQTVYLHIGQTKTATTTLQAFLHGNREWLAANGVFYPEVPHKHPLKAQHRFLVNALHEHKDDFSRAEEPWAYIREQIGQSGLPKVVISEEVFWHLFEQNPKRREEAIHWIREQLKDYDVKIICYLRRQDRWIESWYNQILKTDVTRASQMAIADFVAWYHDIGLLDYNRAVGEWADVFGDDNIILHPFEPARFLNGNVIQDFCGILGISELEGATYPEDLQASLANAACEFSLLYNRSRKALYFKRQMTMVLSEFAGDKNDRRRFLPAALAREILDRYEPGNRLVAARFLPDGEDLFQDKTIAGPELDYPGISAGELSRIVAEIFIHQQGQIRLLQKKINELEAQIAH